MHSNNYTNNLFTIGDVTLNSSDTLQVIDIGESILDKVYSINHNWYITCNRKVNVPIGNNCYDMAKR